VKIKDINALFRNPGLLATVLDWQYDESCNCWVKNGVRVKFMHSMILEAIDYCVYGAVNVRGRDVVDVGAYIGDTAIYFALKGARRVIAVEPHPEAFKAMVENVRLNKLEDRIIPMNAGLSSKLGKICVNKDVDIMHTWKTYHKPGEYTCTIPAITLNEIISKYGLGDDAILKMDCEGCEHDVILNDYDNVAKFKELIFEYHGNPIKILRTLSRGYKCKIISSKKILRLGTIYCIKR